MGLLDTIKKFFDTKNKTAEAEASMRAVNEIAKTDNYTQGVVESFYALAKIGEVFREIKKNDSTTAREYVRMLVDEGIVTDGELEPLILNFEIAKYSEKTITKDDFTKSYDLLNSVFKSLKSGNKAKKSTAKRRKAATSRRRNPAAGAAKRRKSAAVARRRKRGDSQ